MNTCVTLTLVVERKDNTVLFPGKNHNWGPRTELNGCSQAMFNELPATFSGFGLLSTHYPVSFHFPPPQVTLDVKVGKSCFLHDVRLFALNWALMSNGQFSVKPRYRRIYIQGSSQFCFEWLKLPFIHLRFYGERWDKPLIFKKKRKPVLSVDRLVPTIRILVI